PIERPRASFSAACAGAGVALAALSSLFAVWLGGRWTGQALDALGVDNAHAVALAKRARSVQPLSIDPLYYEALAEQSRRNCSADGFSPSSGPTTPTCRSCPSRSPSGR